MRYRRGDVGSGMPYPDSFVVSNSGQYKKIYKKNNPIILVDSGNRNVLELFHIYGLIR